jgi:N,N'-diacetylchitobiose transport system permease protein
VSRDTNLLGVYAYRISIGENDFDTGAAIAIVMVIITVLITISYLRSLLRQDALK